MLLGVAIGASASANPTATELDQPGSAGFEASTNWLPGFSHSSETTVLSLNPAAQAAAKVAPRWLRDHQADGEDRRQPVGNLLRITF